MKRKFLVLSTAFLFACLLTCAFNFASNIGVAPKAQAQDDGGTSGQIEGTWLLTVTPPVPQIPTFKVFVSFARGGAFVASEEFTTSGNVIGDPQNGAWKHIGGHEFASTGMAFGIMPDNNQPGIFKIQSVFLLLGNDELEGKGRLAFCDSFGNNCRPLPGCSTIQGTRVKAEAPSCPE